MRFLSTPKKKPSTFAFNTTINSGSQLQFRNKLPLYEVCSQRVHQRIKLQSQMHRQHRLHEIKPHEVDEI